MSAFNFWLDRAADLQLERDRITAERDAALALLREVRTTHFLALPLLAKIDAALADVAAVPDGDPADADRAGG